MVTVFGHIGSIVLEFFMDKKAVGFYTAAITCAGMTSFVFNALIDSARPVILSYKQTDDNKYQQSMVGLYSVTIYASILQSIVITLFADIVIKILYGSAFLAAVEPLKIIVWYTTFSYLGPVRNIWILAEGKQQYLWIINFLGATISIALNLLLIPPLGVSGAAIAALGTQLFTNVLVGYIIRPIRDCNKLLFKGMNPKSLCGLIKTLVKT